MRNGQLAQSPHSTGPQSHVALHQERLWQGPGAVTPSPTPRAVAEKGLCSGVPVIEFHLPATDI